MSYPGISDYKAAKSKKHIISEDLSWIKNRIVVLEEKLLKKIDNVE